MVLPRTSPRVCLIALSEGLTFLRGELQESKLFQLFSFSSLAAAKVSAVDLVLLDLAERTKKEGVKLLEQSQNRWPDAIISVFVKEKGAVLEKEYLKRGCRTVINLNLVKASELLAQLKKTVFREVLYKSNVQARTPVYPQIVTGSLAEQMGSSPMIRELIEEIELIARTDFRVLIVGETGTGKELIAKSIHDLSTRASDPFKALDCGAIPESLFESLLFGHEKGAFTGAQKSGTGFFRAAAKGTLFLDEISSMDFASQSTLLRALEEKQYYRIGSNQALSAEFRIVSAANKNLAPNEAADTFRSDLYFRLAEYVLRVPPLRARRADLPHLIQRFVRLSSKELNIDMMPVSDDAMVCLLEWSWPGNARELRNVMRRATLLAGLRDRSSSIEPRHILPLGSPGQCNPARGEVAYSTSVPTVGAQDTWKSLIRANRKAFEEKLLRCLLRDSDGNIAEIARRLNADYKSIHSKVKEYKLRK